MITHSLTSPASRSASNVWHSPNSSWSWRTGRITSAISSIAPTRTSSSSPIILRSRISFFVHILPKKSFEAKKTRQDLSQDDDMQLFSWVTYNIAKKLTIPQNRRTIRLVNGGSCMIRPSKMRSNNKKIKSLIFFISILKFTSRYIHHFYGVFLCTAGLVGYIIIVLGRRVE